jgi:hypothetical protein
MRSGRYTAVSGPYRLDLRVDFEGPRAQKRISGDVFVSDVPSEKHAFSFLTVPLAPEAHEAAIEVSHHPDSNAGRLRLGPASSATEDVTLQLFGSTPSRVEVLSFSARRTDAFLRSADLRVYALPGLLPPDSAGLDPVGRPGEEEPLASPVTVSSILEENGFRLRRPPPVILPAAGGGADAAWSDAELHEALIALREAADLPFTEPWPLEVLVAPRSDRPRVLGVLFDTGVAGLGRAAAVFYEAIGSHQKVAHRPRPFAREYLFTCIHEIGHLLRLPHAWVPFGGVGTAERDDRALSFMAYPDNYAFGYTRFYARFPFEFRDEERLHLRHAAWPDIWPGAARQEPPAFLLSGSPPSALGFELRASRSPRFRFGEPVQLELKLENRSRRPVRVPEDVLDFAGGGIQVRVAPGGREEAGKLLHPLLQRDSRGLRLTLGGPGPLPRALYAAIDLTFGRGGFNFLEPGAYTLTATARLPEGQVLTSAPLTIEVEKPTRAEERAAAELLSSRVGLALTLGGDPEGAAMTRLREIAQSALQGLAPWAALRLGESLGAEFKRVTPDRVRLVPPDFAAALRWLELAREGAGESLAFPHLERSRLLEALATCQTRLGQPEQAEKTLAQLSRWMASVAGGNHRLRRWLQARVARLGRRLRSLAPEGEAR